MENFKLFSPAQNRLFLVNKLYPGELLTADIILDDGNVVNVPVLRHKLLEPIFIANYPVKENVLPSYFDPGDMTKDEMVDDIVAILIKNGVSDDQNIVSYYLRNFSLSIKDAWRTLRLYDWSYHIY